MQTHTTPAHKPRLHPLLIAAAVAVLLFCAVGTAAILGWLPSSVGGNRDGGALNTADQLATAPLEIPQTPAPALPPARAPQALAQGLTQAVTQQRDYQPEPRQPQVAQHIPQHQTSQQATQTQEKPHVCANCGVVQSVREITTRAEGSGVGAAGGAVVGGLLGNQVGGGRGRDLATIAGAIGGAVAGNQIEGGVRASRSYDVTVRLDNGSTRTVHQSTQGNWQSGDQVKIVNGVLRANNG